MSPFLVGASLTCQGAYNLGLFGPAERAVFINVEKKVLYLELLAKEWKLLG
jgi:hypothetical protein